MRVRDEWRQPLRPTHFWVSVAAATALLVGMGLFSMQAAGRFPGESRAAWGLLLLLVWTSGVYQFFRYGRHSFSGMRIAGLIGVTLFAGSHALPHSPATAWLGDGGSLLMGLYFLFLFVDFRRPGHRLR